MDMNLGLTRQIVDAFRAEGALRNQVAYALATGYWETARTMRPVREAYWIYPNDPAKHDDWCKRHLRYYPWYGRGLVQLTWQPNYIWGASVTGVPMNKDPDLALEPDAAVTIMVKGMLGGKFTGKKLADFITLQKSDFFHARTIINRLDKAKEIAAIAREYDQILLAEGYGVEAA